MELANRIGPYLLAAALLLAALVVPAADAQDLDWKTGKLERMSRYIGTYRYDAVLDDPAVKTALQALAGADAAAIVANLEVHAPIDFVQGNLVLQGNAPHQGGLEEAILLVKVYDGTLRAGLLHAGHRRLYAPDAAYDYLPGVLRTFLRPRQEPAAPAQLPPGVEWVRRPQP